MEADDDLGKIDQESMFVCDYGEDAPGKDDSNIFADVTMLRMKP